MEGYPFRHEWLFWVLESVPMLVALGVFCLYHPSRVLGADGGKSSIVDEESASPDELQEVPRHG